MSPPAARVISETQTAYVIALMMDMLTPEQRHTAIEHLAERLRIDHVMLTTGFLGTPYICPVLSACGLNEYAYTLLLQKECPSWLFEVSMGATTVWERWNSMRADHSFGPVSMNSFNHYAFGSVAQWLYEYVAGHPPPAGKAPVSAASAWSPCPTACWRTPKPPSNPLREQSAAAGPW